MQGLEKIIDLLKTGGWQSFFVGLALLVFLLLQSWGVIDTTSVPYIVPIVWLLAFFFLGIATASLGDQIKLHFQNKRKARDRRRYELDQRKAFIDDIPHLTEREKQIFAYLIAKNQKWFDADSTGEYASGLVAKGYIVSIARPGSYYTINGFPFEVPNFVWEEIQVRKELFPYLAVNRSRGGGEKAPWIDSPW